jgi:hypothetical protein
MYNIIITIIIVVTITVIAMEDVAAFKVKEKEVRSFNSNCNTTYSIPRSRNRHTPLFSTN